MTTQDCIIVLAPFAVLFTGMLIAFGFHHYHTVKGDLI